MLDPYEVIQDRGFTARIIPDPDAQNPRTEFDNFGTMLCAHGRYTLGDEQFTDADEIREHLLNMLDEDWEEFQDYMNDEWYNKRYDYHYEQGTGEYLTRSGVAHRKAAADVERILDAKAAKILDAAGAVVLPLYLYDHSGITMNTTGFRSSWDSGQVGVIYATTADIVKEYGEDTPETREKATALLRGEVETYDQYLTGDVFGIVLTRDETDEDGDEIDPEDCEELDSCWGFFGAEYAEQTAREWIDAHASVDN